MSFSFAQHQSVLRHTKLVWAGICHHESVLTQIQLQLICASTTTLTGSQGRVAPCQGGRAHMSICICPCHVLMSILLLDMNLCYLSAW